MKLEKIYIFMEPYDYNYRGQGFYIYPFSFNSWDDFQDGLKESYENYPPEVEEWEFVDSDGINDYCVDGIGIEEDNFDMLKEMGEYGEEIGLDIFQILEVASDLGGVDKDYLEEAYRGMFDSVKDYAYELLDDIGISEDMAESYFDWEHFGRELKWDFGEDMLVEEYGYTVSEAQDLMDSRDSDFAEWYIEMIGSVTELGAETLKSYFDYDKFAKDLSYDVTLIEDRIWWNH